MEYIKQIDSRLAPTQPIPIIFNYSLTAPLIIDLF